MEVAELNSLRRRVRACWQDPSERPQALIHLSDEEGDRAAVGQAFQTLCSELGIRHVRLDLADGLTDAHRETLERTSAHPRMVVLTRIDGLRDDPSDPLREIVHAGAARTLPVVVAFAPSDVVGRVRESWSGMRAIRAAADARTATLREAGLGEDGEPLSDGADS